MANIKLKIGDFVRIKSWEELKRYPYIKDEGSHLKNYKYNRIYPDYLNLYAEERKFYEITDIVYREGIETFLCLKDFDSSSYISPWMVEKVAIGGVIEHKSVVKQTPDGISLSFDGNCEESKSLVSILTETEPAFIFNANEYNRNVLGIWDEEEKKEGNRMELLKIYREKAVKKISNLKNEETKKLIEENPIVKLYLNLIEEFENAMENLINSDENLENHVLTQDCSYNSYKYNINCYFRDEISESIEQKYDKIINNFDDKMREVEAQIKLVQLTCNDLTAMKNVLAAYDIINYDGELKEYEIPYEELKPVNGCRCDKTSKKRGRKPKVKVNENNNN